MLGDVGSNFLNFSIAVSNNIPYVHAWMQHSDASSQCFHVHLGLITENVLVELVCDLHGNQWRCKYNFV